MGDEKWILYNNVEWKRLWGKQNEPTSHTKGQSSSKEGDVVYMVGLGVLYYELLLENQMINSNMYCSQLDQLKAALDKKHLELVNRKSIIFHQDNTRPYVSLMIRLGPPTGTAWLGSSDSSAVFTDIAPSDFHLFRSL